MGFFIIVVMFYCYCFATFLWFGFKLGEVVQLDLVKVTLQAAGTRELPGDLVFAVRFHMAVGIADID